MIHTIFDEEFMKEWNRLFNILEYGSEVIDIEYEEIKPKELESHKEKEEQ